jgi:cytochrome c peroxidase
VSYAAPAAQTVYNVAMGKPASQSSTFSADYTANRAVDGVIDSKSINHTNYDVNAWWQVDLGSATIIESLTLWNRTDCCSNRLSNFFVFVANYNMTGKSFGDLVVDSTVWRYSLGTTAPAILNLPVNTTGRYVRVQLAGTNNLHLTEVQVFGTPTTTAANVAQGKPASQSSTFSADYPASRAVDGNTDGNHLSKSINHTNYEVNAWWQVDLGSATTINTITLWNRTDCCSDRLSNFFVFVANYDMTGKGFGDLVVDNTVWRYSLGTTAPTTLNIPVNSTGRYVRVQLAGTNSLHLAEVQVFGAANNTPSPVATVADGVYLVKAVHSGKCMEVAGAGTGNGSNVQQWSCVPTATHHQWQFTAIGDGYYKIINVNSGKALDVAGISWADGANIYQWDYLNGSNQKWKPVPQSDGSYQLVAAHSNKCVNVYGAWTHDGANIIQYPCGPWTNENFRLLPAGIESLKGVPIPEDANINNYVVNRQAAKVLGKALFWDMAVSSDGQTACASCHFHAGADPRTKNQLNPGILHLSGAPTNSTYNPTRSGNAGGVNYRMTAADFPTFVLADPHNRDSQILFQTDDVVSSQGVYSERYVDTTPGNPSDQCALVFDNRFHLGGISTRRVEPRNTPTTINAVFNLRNFWDGRANETFNGVNPFGTRDPNAGIYQFNGFWVSKIQPNLRFSSLASQAVGPPLSDFEMSCAQRVWPNVGRRLLSRTALQGQQIASNDSLLSSYRATSGVGLSVTYQQLIDQAFNASYRNNSWQVALGGVNYKLSEANFSFFFGLALQLYQGTLVSDDAPIDRYLSGSDMNALTPQEVRGAAIFSSKGKCTECHSGPQLTNAGTPAINDFKQGAIVSHMILGDGQTAIYDEGFYNIGVRPTIEDIGVGGTDPFGNPLSFTAQYKKFLQSWTPFVDKSLTVNPCTFEVNPCVRPTGSVRTAVDGAFKTPTLRNVELTGPYFHNGSRSTLEQVVEFYNRGGDRRGNNANNSSGFGANPSNLDADIEPLGLTASEMADLVAFLKRPLTDRRVQCDQAPFDHPQLIIPNGHVGNNVAVTNDGTGRAVNEWFTIPAVGANGMCGSDLSGRRRTFEEILAANGIFASDALETNFAMTLNTPLTTGTELLTDTLVSEAPIESLALPDAMVVIEEDVAVTLTDENTVTGAYQIFLPQVSR